MNRTQIDLIVRMFKFKQHHGEDSYILEVIEDCPIYLYYFKSNQKGQSGWRIQFRHSGYGTVNYSIGRLDKPHDILVHLAEFISQMTARNIREEDMEILDQSLKDINHERWRAKEEGKTLWKHNKKWDR